MAIIDLVLAATKLAGVLASLTVAANAFSFSRYRKKNLRSFDSPIDESADTLAAFNLNPSGLVLYLNRVVSVLHSCWNYSGFLVQWVNV